MKIKNGIRLYKYAKTLIPGGTTLFSKRSELHLPYKWPAYFTRAKKINVWDLKGDKYLDMFCAVGTSVLGYGNAKVNKSVLKNIDKGNMTTLNCPEEVFLAKQMIKQHPWSSMAKFTRSGGEANALAIRIARSFTKKNNVAFCGYHGWHDWYLSANIKDKNNLSSHLMTGLSPNGVPKELKNTSIPFDYNNFEQIKKIADENNLAAIKMEVQRNFPPKNNFLQKIRKLCNQKGIVLIFDECTSGFRQTFGGLHKIYGVEPDIAWFGKALGNGYAITAIIGKSSVMDAAQNSFISSTFWTERIGPAAALKTLEEMEKIKSWEIITKIGVKMQKGWSDLGKSNNLDITISGLPPITNYRFNSSYMLEYKTFVTQEMLKKGFLASTNFYACIEHSDDLMNLYFDSLNEIFKIISKCESEELNILDLLEGPVCHSGFERLN